MNDENDMNEMYNQMMDALMMRMYREMLFSALASDDIEPSELVQTQEEYQILEKIYDELLEKEDYEKCSIIREVLDNFDLNDLPKLQIISDGDGLESNGSMKSVDFGTISFRENGGVFYEMNGCDWQLYNTGLENKIKDLFNIDDDFENKISQMIEDSESKLNQLMTILIKTTKQISSNMVLKSKYIENGFSLN